MHYRRVASLVLGAWIGCCVLMMLTLHQFRDVEHVFNRPALEHREVITSLPAGPLRQILRYHAWEESRILMYGWGAAQLAIAPLLMWLTLLSTRTNRLVLGAVGIMLIVACLNQFVIGPEMTYAGRAFDFGTAGVGRARYLLLNGLFMTFEGLKVAVGLAVAGYLFTYRSRRDAAPQGGNAESKGAVRGREAIGGA